MMELKPGNFCPLLKKDCVGMKCSWFTQVRGTNPNTGKEVDEWGCAIAWMPVLMIENSGQQRSTGAAVESFRNEMVKANNMATIMTAIAMKGNGNASIGYDPRDDDDDIKRIGPSGSR